jgi:hypothetical protein
MSMYGLFSTTGSNVPKRCVMNVEKNRKSKRRKDSSPNLEDYKPGATQAQVFKALKKVAKSPRPSEKPSQ